jgi:hypothetical protein
VRAIWAQRLLPGLADHLAARMAWDGQMYDGAVDADQPNDLYQPVPGHQSAHGAFDARARSNAWEFQLSMGASRVTTALSDFAGVAVRSIAARRKRASDAQVLSPVTDGKPEPLPAHR